ncbi:flagellar brake protein [Metabacillus sediminilitoris]|uniref:Pilus assembly protein PilZ n=1 Tax=Metabacillus sediminilitoris TaxID=2567941 RepID=A0A4S4C6G6_9BACI|nr:flagellar brake domain-containing protein [Metabacillus sediminilitoris]QGQ46715.1 pilus assembly protein PilZ [Metabacillus sediminilitoris]THF82865.1 pilus assembly protein PilZ [Metabacillus sediminilitoris]
MLSIGDVIFLETKTDNVERFKCKLVERKGNQLYIDYPTNASTGRTAYLMIGTELSVSFVNKDQQAFRFQTVVTGRVKDRIPMISLAYPGEDDVIRIQRREFVRIDVTLDVAVHPVNNEFQPFVAVTTDISAGGAAIILPKSTKLKQDQELIVWFSLPFQNEKIEYIKIKAKIVRFLPMENESFQKAPLQFLEIDEATRQTLLRYCFNQQIQMRRKGLIKE